MTTLSLSGASWEFRDATTPSPWRPAQTPGCVHTDLLRAGKIPDPFWGTNELQLQWIEERVWEYRRTFDVPNAFFDEEVVELVADGLDTVATVTLNGQVVARTENMFVGYRWDVKPLLRPKGNELHIRFGSAVAYIRNHSLEHQPREFSDPVGRSSVIRKQQCQFGWDWGPRFVTAGVWRDLRLEAWSKNRLVSVIVAQTHAPDGAVTLTVSPELLRADETISLRGHASLDGRPVAAIENGRCRIEKPSLWWPNGHGAQPLYIIDLAVLDANGRAFGRWTRRIGLRTIVLDRHADEWGESFQFLVNGRPIFAKGANWIPAHSFVTSLTRDDYARNLAAAVHAHMNCIRVWGGGIYESTDFYDLCDELGLLVWQDFMFSCALYPGNDPFLALVPPEIEYQVRRLRHHASLALWCGNNEVAMCNGDLLADPTLRANYEKLFHQIIPDTLAAHDRVTPYWPSSPWRSGWSDLSGSQAGTIRGDSHYWEVWHARKPVKDYEKYPLRFASEFGMQAYCSPATQATFCPPEDANVFGPTMENHQKNRAGNQIILDYISRRYRFPKDQEALIYLSQINQAHCIETAVEHYRRNMPRCMGALYWQLNDCWPVASWSSIEFNGRWRALHHAARRFFAPFLVCAHVPGCEEPIIGNYRRNSIREVHLYTVCDAPIATTGLLRWDIYHLDGRSLDRGEKPVELRHGESLRHQTLDLKPLLDQHGRDHLYVRLALDVDGVRVSENTVLFVPPRFMPLPRATTAVDVHALAPNAVQLAFTSPVFQHAFMFTFDALPGHFATDNFFDLHPSETKNVTVTFDEAVDVSQVRQQLKTRSLVDAS
jgi:Beta-galactosidase/beta-glucuronidase